MSLFGRPSRRDLHSLAAPYALDALEHGERARFEKHLAKCERCTADVRALSEDAVRLAWSTAAPAPLAMRDRVLAAVRSTPQEAPSPDAPIPDAAFPRPQHLPPHVWGTEPPPPPRRARRSRPLFAPLATATAATALVVASLFAVQANRAQDQLDAERDRSREIANILAAPDARATSERDTRGRGIGVIASVKEGRAVVTLSGLDDLPSGRVHQLWLMRPDRQPRSLGLFQGDTPLVTGGMNDDATSLAVTIEPDGGSPQPTSQPIAQLALETVGFGE
ncbi:anti-sigma factor domain-containing protein [Streptomyces phyllanthi]|uniref:Regulator of SigK n=1 Tax=Streptomyces phyllanthi TaxID=1803180 RepID=A0A5N8WAS1_9ACTN|nr:anti-sigma factor [Streptomyces phyllanthi]MPY44577.1 anti-sigma factor [Streptomyces phyllanthi]